MNIVAPPLFFRIKNAMEDDNKVALIWGGKGSGKSHNALLTILLRFCEEKQGNYLFTRKVQAKIKASILNMCDKLIIKYSLPLKIVYSPNAGSIRNKYGMNIFCMGLDNPIQIQSTSSLRLGFCEEATEITKEDYDIISDNVREGGGKLLLLFNPKMANNHWLATDIMDNQQVMDKTTSVHSWVHDNPEAWDKDGKMYDYISYLQGLKDTDEVRYRINYLGQRAILVEDLYFPNIKRGYVPIDAKLLSYGIDFGYSPDPTTVVSIYEYENNLHIMEWLYERNLPIITADQSLPSLAKFIKDNLHYKDYFTMCDNSRPDSINDLKRELLCPFFIGAKKGKGSIEDGLTRISAYSNIIIETNSHNAYSEFVNYRRLKQNGILLPKPAPGQSDHCIDAVRYALTNKSLSEL